MKTDNFDSILAGIRNDAPDPAVVAQAAARVRSRLFPAAGAAQTTAHRLETCADFQALIPAYLNRTLSPARSLLLTDHTHSCVACRQALETARSGNVRMLPRPKAVSTQVSPATRWAVAAMLAVSTGLGSWALVRSLMVPPGTRATVQSVSGALYEVTDASSTPIYSGRQLGERQLVRTAKNATAVLKLTDGSLVEIAPRSQLSISRASRGATIYLAHGNVIVHAAKQRTGALYVKTADCEISVKGTIFAVSQGTKGSRVSVVEGSVKVDQGSKSQLLKPGDQVTTSASVDSVPVQDEIAWSRNSANYLAILHELSGLQKQIEQLPSSGLRTSSKFLDLVPANTVLYAAIPNIGDTLGQAGRLFEERIQASPVLRQWWSEQGKDALRLPEILAKVQAAGTYLGDEIVLAVSADSAGRPASVLLLAETRQPGLREFLHSQNPSLTFIDDPSAVRLTDSNAHTPKVYLAKGIVAVTTETAKLQELAVHFQQDSPRSAFTNTDFHKRIEQAYQSGAGWLFCANLAPILRSSGTRQQQRDLLNGTGLSGVHYLILERKDVSGQIQNQATLAFDGDRRGLASWLAAPGPMSTLDFVSPEASLASAFVVRSPGAMLGQLLAQSSSVNPDFQERIQTFQSRTGVNIVNDIADALGGEVTFAIDGPLVPVPSWKIAAEVYNPDRLQTSVERLVQAMNRNNVGVEFLKSQEGSRTFYTLKAPAWIEGLSGFEIHYVFVDGYLLAAANRDLLNTSIQNRSTGYTLTHSEKFRASLPHDANSNFSALVYHNAGGVVGPLVDNLKHTNIMTPEQKQAGETFQRNSAPGLIYAYGEPDRIILATNGSLFGFNLENLALPQIFQSMLHLKQDMLGVKPGIKQ